MFAKAAQTLKSRTFDRTKRTGPAEQAFAADGGPSPSPPRLKRDVSHLARALSDNYCYFLVCLLEREPIGYLSAYRFPDVEHDGFLVYLYDIVVRVDHRRRGVARRLIEALLEHCRVEGVSRIWVGTSRENHAAAQAFEATGASRESETYVEFTYALAGGDRAV